MGWLQLHGDGTGEVALVALVVGRGATCWTTFLCSCGGWQRVGGWLGGGG